MIENKSQKAVQKEPKQQLKDARSSYLSDFGGIEHRLELVDSIEGVDYINDSKATDFHSTLYSLDCMEQPVIWIVSRSEFENEYELFQEQVTNKVRAVICLGETSAEMFGALAKNPVLFSEAQDISEAVEIGRQYANEGDVVLFSPACSSYELFENYKERGEAFRKAVVLRK